MPAGYRKERPYPGQGFTLEVAAKQNVLIIYRCTMCRRPAQRYLASDLLRFGDPGAWADQRVFPCSKCGTTEYIRVGFHYPSPGDYGHLTVRRPGQIKMTQLWRTVRLGD